MSEKEVILTGATKAMELLEKYPWLADELVKQNDAFKMINNPLVRGMFKNATLEDICQKFNLDLNLVVAELTKMIQNTKDKNTQ